MYRSILFNCWIALITFAFYFVTIIYQTAGTADPLKTIAMAFLWAVIGFVFAYALRVFFDYILYTPEQIDVAMKIEAMKKDSNELAGDETSESSLHANNNSTIEFHDESSEDIAQVVRTMLSRDEPFIEK